MALIIDPQGKPSGPGSGGGGGGGDVVIDSDTNNFAADVIDASMECPVIVDFWAPWCGPCKQLTPLLEKLVRQAAGLVRLVKINVDENQGLAAQLRIQSVPTVYGFVQGRPIDAFVGGQTESAVREFIGRLTGGAQSPVDQLMEAAQATLEAGDARGAIAAFSQVLAEDPRNIKAISGLIRARLGSGDVAGARSVIASLTPDLIGHSEIKAAVSAVELAEQSDSTGDVAALEAKVSADPSDHQARFDWADALFASGNAEGAIDALLDIVRADREWNDGAARLRLLKFLEALGPTHPLTIASRRRLSRVLFS